MLAGENNNQQQDRINRAQALVERVQNAYSNTSKIKRFFNIILLVSMIPPFFLLVQFLLYSWLVDYFLKPGENETKLSAWPKNVIRLMLKTVLVVCIITSCIFLALPALFLWLLNRALIEEIRQFFNLMQEVPEEEMQLFMHDLVNVLPFVAQTTHDPNAVSSVNLSVDKLVKKYKENLSREEFYIQLNRGNTTDIEEYIRQSNEFKADEKSQALECLQFVNIMTEDSFKDNYSQLTLKQAAILCWKACSDRNTGMEGQAVPLSDRDIKNRKDMFVRGLIDAATTYGNQGQSCAGGTYNKLFESLAGLHPLVVITLDEKEASRMVEETITQGFPEMARENLKNFSGKEQEKIRNELPELSPETVRYIITTHSALEKKFKEFSSKLDNNKQKEISETCMNNLSYVELGNPSTERAK
ncbi:hypothetical protein [Wolbachia endosymbiont of Ctenocephalides felis wCfeJ]|uniref:hypothetical protein n=1 Tax=Wolbachia endosymbiont of Ctenocephalides felis wCfeJ TaxID=2732594 RepID=UPI0014469BBE|nr:hypothetical protein [Wolbachia endosymbiont of Ctenocephalides felis wCfeJ]WCR58199.1 MAG: hypothetical protein PG980_000671 [Wolbachia endosymbiont of Ctenocephalides felis wCfeJ]